MHKYKISHFRHSCLALSIAAACAGSSTAMAGEQELQAQIDLLAKQLQALQTQLAEQKAAPAPAAVASGKEAASGPGNFRFSVSGTLDAALGSQGNVAPGGAASQGQTTKFFNAGLATSNLAFTGSTELGEGLTALFKLDTELLTSTGANLVSASGQIAPSSYNAGSGSGVVFNRAAYAGLAGRYGTLTLGRQQTVAVDAVVKVEASNFTNFFMSSAYGAWGLGNAIYGQGLLNTAAGKYSPGVANNLDSRDNAMIKYTSPVIGGARLIAGYSPGAIAGSGSMGTKAALGATYDVGNLSVGGSYTEWHPVDLLTNQDARYRLGNFGVAYRFGDLSLRAAMGHTSLPAVTVKDTTNTNVTYSAADASVKSVGAIYAVNPRLDLLLSYYIKRYDIVDGNKPRVDTLGVGATWLLYKNTKLYALFDNARSRGDNGANQTLGGHSSANAVALGFSHAFNADLLR
ncbi:porin [Zoogloea sp.]|uniref:porin n=1 Tax=Zoogloea sp. TaxID=49181 RepID=UPI0035B1C750